MSSSSPSSTPFHGLNLNNQSLPSPTSQSFTVTAASGTDLWRKPPSTTPFNAPIIYKPVPLGKFVRARVSFAAAYKIQYDQGGIVFVLADGLDGVGPSSSSSSSSSSQDAGGIKPRFVKAGVEFEQGEPRRSVVAVDRWADWSLGEGIGGEEVTTVELEREREEDGKWGTSLWVYAVEKVGDGEKRTPLREVTWMFHDVKPEAECWVGAFAAKPKGGEDVVLTVKAFEIEVME